MKKQWQVISGPTGFGFWVVEEGWSFQDRSSIVATSVPFERAIQMIKDHNNKSQNGRPKFPLNRDIVRFAMGKNKYKVAPAARMLGIGERSLHRWLKEHRQHPNPAKTP